MTSEYPRPEPQTNSASAPRLASFSTLTGSRSRRSISIAALTPTQPGQDRGRAHGARRPVDRAGEAHPHPDHPLAVDFGLLEHLVDQLRRGVEPLLRRVVDVELAPGLREHLVGEIRHRHPEVGVAEVDARRRGRRTDSGRAAPAAFPQPRHERRLSPPPARSAGPPRSGRRRCSRPWSARARSRRAISARLAVPRPRSASMTRPRLSSRRDRRDPESADSTRAAPLTNIRALSSVRRN